MMTGEKHFKYETLPTTLISRLNKEPIRKAGPYWRRAGKLLLLLLPAPSLSFIKQ